MTEIIASIDYVTEKAKTDVSEGIESKYYDLNRDAPANSGTAGDKGTYIRIKHFRIWEITIWACKVLSVNSIFL